MNERCAGAIEALAWVLKVLDGVDDVVRIRRRIEGVRDQLLHGVAVDFGQKMDVH